MGDFAPIPALGAGVAPIRPATIAQTNVVVPVAGSSDSRGAEARMDTAPQQGRPQTRQDRGGQEGGTKLNDRKSLDDFVLVGPSPAFQANVLELERDLQRTIERMEAERSRVEAEAAIKIERAEARADAAEADSAKAQSVAPDPAPAVAARTEPAEVAEAPDSAAPAETDTEPQDD